MDDDREFSDGRRATDSAGPALATTGDADRSAGRMRRRDDMLGSRVMFDMVRFLMTRPSSDQIAQHLVLNLMTAHRPRTAVIALFGSDGSLHVVGAFGLTSAALESHRSLSLWDSAPMSDAVRSGEPVVIETARQAQDLYPWLGSRDVPYEPLAAWPLCLPSQRVGALQLTFTQPPDEAALRGDATGIAAVLALYLSLLAGTAPAAHRTSRRGEKEEGVGPGTAVAESTQVARGRDADSLSAVPSGHPSSDCLTDRQQRILALMAQGLTNIQISMRVGFSESTVRQETMAIYRYLGVSGRRDAIRLAGMRGMLEAHAG